MTMSKSIPVDASSNMLEGYESKPSNGHHEKHAPKRLFEFKKSIPTSLSLALGLAVWVIFFGAWQLSSALGLVNDLLFPAPTKVVAALYDLIANQGFIVDIGVSLYRILVSFSIACAIAIPLGILMGCFKAVEAFFGPFVSAWRYLPAPALIPLLLMWLGAGEEQKLALLILGVIWFLITLISDHTKTVRTELIETAVTLGGNRLQVLKTVVIPAVMPDILVVMRQMMAVSWTYLVIAEIVAADSGIGAMMMRAKRFIHVDEIMAGILVIGVLGLLLDLLLRLAHRVLFPYLDDHRK
jgi:NitT/TauT family transport system permease protein